MSARQREREGERERDREREGRREEEREGGLTEMASWHGVHGMTTSQHSLS